MLVDHNDRCTPATRLVDGTRGQILALRIPAAEARPPSPDCWRLPDAASQTMAAMRPGPVSYVSRAVVDVGQGSADEAGHRATLSEFPTEAPSINDSIRVRGGGTCRSTGFSFLQHDISAPISVHG